MTNVTQSIQCINVYDDNQRRENNRCVLSKLPDDMIQYILSYLITTCESKNNQMYINILSLDVSIKQLWNDMIGSTDCFCDGDYLSHVLIEDKIWCEYIDGYNDILLKKQIEHHINEMCERFSKSNTSVDTCHFHDLFDKFGYENYIETRDNIILTVLKPCMKMYGFKGHICCGGDGVMIQRVRRYD